MKGRIIAFLLFIFEMFSLKFLIERLLYVNEVITNSVFDKSFLEIYGASLLMIPLDFVIAFLIVFTIATIHYVIKGDENE
jgi:hypothetical protein